MGECKGPYNELKGYSMDCLTDLIAQVEAEAAANKDQIGGAGMWTHLLYASTERCAQVAASGLMQGPR